MNKIKYSLLALCLSASAMLAQDKFDETEQVRTKAAKEIVLQKAVSPETTNSVNTAATIATYDFTVAGAAYVDATKSNPPMKDLGGGVYGMIAGDVNGDGKVKYNGSSADRVAILVEVGFTTPNNVISGVYSASDVNMDGDVKYNGSSADRVDVLVGVGFTTPNNVIETHVPK